MFHFRQTPSLHPAKTVSSKRLRNRTEESTILQCIKGLESEEIILAREIIPEIDHFPVPGNLGFVGITGSFKKGQRDAIHPAAIKKTNPARSNCDYLLAAAYFTSPFH
ncbi:hypothetical protein TNCT_394861 [Trichonephila clavata]|uniref:Uncharacterized protein n=1 Tax=Trichonephila clavata TaxID=2740835 RepID=A0A8X6HEK7_TRICU|nr:hypothetical protein TNCT_481171 [Trichonephila clavata]GFR22307.1 hypothetical protein TNCT_394861 [Trichonephila clavata]